MATLSRSAGNADEFGLFEAAGGPDGWGLEEELETAKQLVQRVRDREPGTESAGRTTRIDQPHLRVASTETTPPEKTGTKLIGWTLIAIGLTSAVFGGALLVWSSVASRPDLVPVGLPFTVAGQAVLILGLITQLDNVSRTQRATRESLEALTRQVRTMQQEPASFASPTSRLPLR